MTAVEEIEAPPSLLDARRRALTIGLVLTVSTIAFEALAVATVVPAASHQLHGVRLYGWVFSAFMLADLVGITIAGRQADRRGPATVYATGLAMFSGGLVLGGLAPHMLVLVIGRAVQGLGAGALSSTAFVVVARAYPEGLRPKMLAVMSSAWVVPGLVGPAAAGWVADALSWRVVFLALVATAPPAAWLTIPALHHLGPPDVVPVEDGDEAPVRTAIQLALGTGVGLAGLTLRPAVLGIPLAAVGTLVAIHALRRLLPAGSVSARPGMPAAVALRACTTFAFFGAEAFLPLGLTSVRHLSNTAAGACLTSAALSWTAGAWLQVRLAKHWSRAMLLRSGLFTVMIGIAGLATGLVSGVPLAVVIAAWGVSGLGMGVTYNCGSLVVIDAAPPGQEGTASASLQLADVLGTAVGTGIGGAAVALAVASGWGRRTGIEIAFMLAFSVGALGVAIGRRAAETAPMHST
jgi:MFS family permease